MVLIIQFISMFFGYLLLTTGLTKTANISKHYSTVHAYAILPKGLTSLFVWFDTVLELILGFCLITGTLLIFSVPLTGGLFALYTIAILINLIRGVRNIDCGCGGAVGEHKLSYTLIARNVFLIIVLLAIFSLSYESYRLATFKFDLNYLIMHSILIPLVLLLYKIGDLQSIRIHLKKV